MAMYENEGFCPNNSFLRYQLENYENVPEFWERTREILGDRTGYMVYTENGCSNNDWCYVVDCLVGSTTTLGVEVACKLEAMIPDCVYGKTGRKILVTDVISHFQIPGLNRKAEKFSGSDHMYVLEDNRYVVGITEEGEAVHLYFFKKAQE